MTHVRIKGIKLFKDRHGKLRCYHRATGKPVDLEKYPLGTAEFQAYFASLAVPEIKPRTGTLARLIAEYRLSPSFTNLRQNTKNYYDVVFRYLEPIGDTPLVAIDRALILRIRDKALGSKGWYFANQLATVLAAVFSWGIDRGHMPGVNPASRIKRIPRPKHMARANRPWTDAERYAVLEASDFHVGVPIALMMFIGMDPIDALTLPKEGFDGQAVEYTRTKTGNSVWRPAPAALKNILSDAPAHKAKTLAVNSKGKSWTRSGFNSTWIKLRTELENAGKIGKGLTLKGLRHSHATILGEMGEDDRTIADALAQNTEGMARWYSRDANRREKLKKVTKQLDAEERQRRKKVSNRGKKLSNR